jgi:hypothetical protein
MTNSIQLYGKTYAKLPKDGAKTPLPEGANGFYEKEAGGVVFYHPERGPRAFIRKDGLGPVSLGHHDGKRYYMHSHSSLEGDWMGIPDSYIAETDGARALAKELYP